MKAGVRAVKRAVVVDAMQWTGKNAAPLKAWMMTLQLRDHGAPQTPQHLFIKRRQTGMTETLFRNVVDDPKPECSAALWVAANESYLPLVDGEWVMHDELGFYPCQEAVFERTYDVLPADG